MSGIENAVARRRKFRVVSLNDFPFVLSLLDSHPAQSVTTFTNPNKTLTSWELGPFFLQFKPLFLHLCLSIYKPIYMRIFPFSQIIPFFGQIT